MKRFENKVAVVTGGAMGLGAATVRRLADEGARVLIVDIDAGRAEKLIAELPGAGHLLLQTDLSQPAEIEKLAQRIAEVTGDVHVLVNNAGINARGSIEEFTEENWERGVGVNLRAALLLTKALIPLMRDRDAAIVNVSSERGHNTGQGDVVYDITKAGLGALTRSTASELWKYGIRVNELAPGGMVTEMHFGTGPDAAERKQAIETWTVEHRRKLREVGLEGSPGLQIMARMAEPTEVAPAIAFLASSDASFVTGITLHVNGGLALR